MPSAPTLLAFVGATVLILLVPGPSVAYVVARSLERGRRAGLVSMLGLETGALLHVGAAAIGLGALLTSSDTAFTVVRWVGAAYLAWLGVSQLRESRRSVADHRRAGRTTGRLFLDGVLVDVLNPKTALFFVAFLPQFVDAAHGSSTVQIVVLGLVFVLLAAVTDGSYALLAGGLASRVGTSRRTQARLCTTTGGVYLGLATLTVVV